MEGLKRTTVLLGCLAPPVVLGFPHNDKSESDSRLLLDVPQYHLFVNALQGSSLAGGCSLGLLAHTDQDKPRLFMTQKAGVMQPPSFAAVQLQGWH